MVWALLMVMLVVGCDGESPRDAEGDDPGECSDGADNDRNGRFDCDDDGCRGAPDCKKAAPAPDPSPAGKFYLTCRDGQLDQHTWIDFSDGGCAFFYNMCEGSEPQRCSVSGQQPGSVSVVIDGKPSTYRVSDRALVATGAAEQWSCMCDAASPLTFQKQ